MSRKVLVVDDEKLIVKGIRFSLEQDGMEVSFWILCCRRWPGWKYASRSANFPMCRS